MLTRASASAWRSHLGLWAMAERVREAEVRGPMPPAREADQVVPNPGRGTCRPGGAGEASRFEAPACGCPPGISPRIAGRRTSPPIRAEAERLGQDERREINWKRWGPYLSERQWGTVREDYSRRRQLLGLLPARSRAQPRVPLGRGRPARHLRSRGPPLLRARALERPRPDPEGAALRAHRPRRQSRRGRQGIYFYLDSTPTHSYMKALYKYPQAEFPYARLVDENRRRGKEDPEFELADTGVFDGRPLLRRLRRVREGRRGRRPDPHHDRQPRPRAGADPRAADALVSQHLVVGPHRRGLLAERPHRSPRRRAPSIAEHESLGRFRLDAAAEPAPALLFTENETNVERLFGAPNATPYVKDAFHAAVVGGRAGAVNPEQIGTKAALRYSLEVPAGEEVRLRLRLPAGGCGRRAPGSPTSSECSPARIAGSRRSSRSPAIPDALTGEERNVVRQAYAGLLWTKQFYHYIVERLARGRSGAAAAAARAAGTGAIPTGSISTTAT